MGLILITAANVSKDYKDSKNNLNSLLCMRSSFFYQSELITSINNLNKVILINFPLKNSPIPYASQAAKLITLASKAKQQYEIYNYYKNIISTPYCSAISKLNLQRAHPYKLSLLKVLKRDLSGVTILERKEFTSKYFNNFKYMYSTKIKIKSALNSKVYVKFSESLISKVLF